MEPEAGRLITPRRASFRWNISARSPRAPLSRNPILNLQRPSGRLPGGRDQGPQRTLHPSSIGPRAPSKTHRARRSERSPCPISTAPRPEQRRRCPLKAVAPSPARPCTTQAEQQGNKLAGVSGGSSSMAAAGSGSVSTSQPIPSSCAGAPGSSTSTAAAGNDGRARGDVQGGGASTPNLWQTDAAAAAAALAPGLQGPGAELLGQLAALSPDPAWHVTQAANHMVLQAAMVQQQSSALQVGQWRRRGGGGGPLSSSVHWSAWEDVCCA